MELERSLYPTLWCCLAVLPVMMKQQSGSIVNVGSQSTRGLYRLALRHQQGRHPGADQGAGDGIRPPRHPHQCDGPGRHGDFRPRGAAPVHQARHEVEEPADEAAYRREMGEDIRNQQALKRRGLPEEQAAAIAFLASDDASFITGQVINCSGGQS